MAQGFDDMEVHMYGDYACEGCSNKENCTRFPVWDEEAEEFICVFYTQEGDEK